MKLFVCFLWHMHQPFYRDPETGTYVLPWVRLHGIKDYAALPRIFRGVPSVRHTFNLVPSLLVQLRDYVERGAEDAFLAVSRKSALDLSRDEEAFVLRNFFSCFPPTMILPNPRYADLYRRRADALRALDRPGAPGGFGASEYTDLVTLFNLVWFNPIHRAEDPELERLWRKGSGYTERDKAYVLRRQLEVLAEVLPEYARVVREDGGELSLTPMYHPILPLLVSTDAAREAAPGAPLPRVPFAYPEDAAEQIARAAACFREFFGFVPRGLWPSEGSLSPAALELIAGAGFAWTATDEILLSKAIGRPIVRDARGVPVEPDLLYGAYRPPGGARDAIRLFFRDHHLSDLIGFEYSRWEAADAAADFAARIAAIYQRLRDLPAPRRREAYVVPVILDGENAWEYFPDSGIAFIELLLRRCQALGPEISFSTFTNAMQAVDNTLDLPIVPTGSWIDGTFKIWIGHEEDRQAWEALAAARALFQAHRDGRRRTPNGASPDLARAYEHLLVAEGSDWCWWYGDDHFTAHAAEFDRLFRHHIKAAYRAMGEAPPASLDLSIVRLDRVPSATNRLPAPRGYIRPRIDGSVSSYFEWSAAARYIPSPEYGAMHRAGHGILHTLHYGFDESTLYLRLDLCEAALKAPGTIAVDLAFPAKNRKVALSLHPELRAVEAGVAALTETPAEEHGAAAPEAVAAAFNTVLEIAIPFRVLGCEREQNIEFFVAIRPEGSPGERWPLYGNLEAELPGTDFEQRMWEV